MLVSRHVRTRRAVFDSFVLFELCCFSLLLDLVWLFCLAIVFGYCVWLLMAARDRLCVCSERDGGCCAERGDSDCDSDSDNDDCHDYHLNDNRHYRNHSEHQQT